MRSATTAKTEEKTFEAVRQAIDELAALVGYVVNNLNGNHVVVTADHGFLFTESAPGETGQEQARREARGHGPGEEALPDRPQPPRPRGGLARQDERDGRGRGRHGVLDSQGRPTASTSPAALGSSTAGRCSQEIVVPVVTVRHIEGKSAKETKTKPVTVQVLGSNHKITTHRHRFELIQMEPVSERVKADHAEGRRLRGRRAGHEHRDRDVRQRFGQHGRAEEVGAAWCCRTGSTTRRRPTASCCGTPRPASSSRAWRW